MTEIDRIASIPRFQMTTKGTIKIIMDDRERTGAVFRKLSAMDDVNVSIKRLSAGDYLVGDRLLFERKTLKDFALSVIDGRLFRQTMGLTASGYTGVLILEGGSRDIGPTGIQREALQGALIFVSLVLRVPVLRAMNSGETAKLLIYAARQTHLAVEGGIARSGRRPTGKHKRQIFILQGLPNVGPKRAAQLLKRFGSAQQVLNASVEELTSVDGIGKETARRIRWAVNEPPAAYGLGASTIIAV